MSVVVVSCVDDDDDEELVERMEVVGVELVVDKSMKVVVEN